jgi:Restriction endonuclease
MQTAKQKGDVLEAAVEVIEKSNLRAVPDALIECKKLVNLGGVNHEIDVYVTARFAPHYSAVFVFECKNWAAPVDKNEIIIFSEKIFATRAAHGYFVAKKFTSGAKAQAANDPRMTLLSVEEQDPLLLAPHFSQKGYESKLEGLGFCITATDGSQLRGSEAATEVLYQGDRKPIVELLQPPAEQAATDCMRTLLEEKEQGEHRLWFSFQRDFPNGDLEIRGKVVQKITGHGFFYIFVYKPAIQYSFDVKSRARIINWAPVYKPDGSVMKMNMIFRYKEGLSGV